MSDSEWTENIWKYFSHIYASELFKMKINHIAFNECLLRDCTWHFTPEVNSTTRSTASAVFCSSNMKIKCLYIIHTDTAVWTHSTGKITYCFPFVQFRVVFLNTLQICSFWIGISSCYIDASVHDHCTTLHSSLHHVSHLLPLILLWVIAVRDRGLSTHKIDLVL